MKMSKYQFRLLETDNSIVTPLTLKTRMLNYEYHSENKFMEKYREKTYSINNVQK